MRGQASQRRGLETTGLTYGGCAWEGELSPQVHFTICNLWKLSIEWITKFTNSLTELIIYERILMGCLLQARQ